MEFNIELRTVVIDCKDAYELAYFYKKLLGWEFTYEEDNWILMRNPSGCTGLSFQSESWYEKPIWPEETGKPTKMIHLDFKVSDLDEAIKHAISCGAEHAPAQFLDNIHVMIDPAGHPFCLFTD